MPKLEVDVIALYKIVSKLRSSHQVEIETLCSLYQAEVERFRNLYLAEIERSFLKS